MEAFILNLSDRGRYFALKAIGAIARTHPRPLTLSSVSADDIGSGRFGRNAVCGRNEEEFAAVELPYFSAEVLPWLAGDGLREPAPESLPPAPKSLCPDRSAHPSDRDGLFAYRITRT